MKNANKSDLSLSELRFNCEKCGYCVFRVDKIYTVTNVDRLCPQCGTRNVATFYPPQTTQFVPKGRRGVKNDKTIPHQGSLRGGSQGERADLHRPDNTRLGSYSDHLEMPQVRLDPAQELPGGEVWKKWMFVQQWRDAGRRLVSLLSKAIGHPLVGSRDRSRSAEEHEGEDPLAGNPAGAAGGGSDLSPVGVHAHDQTVSGEIGTTRAAVSGTCWATGCTGAIFDILLISVQPPGQPVEALLEVQMCALHQIPVEQFPAQYMSALLQRYPGGTQAIVSRGGEENVASYQAEYERGEPGEPGSP